MLKFMRVFGKRTGFTLVEMLVTLALLAVVTAITGVICLTARGRSRALVCHRPEYRGENPYPETV